MTKSVILFDGVCNLCNSFVNWVVRHDRKDRFVFASLQSDRASILIKDTLALKDIRTIILIENGKKYVRSTAALRIFKGLGRRWSWLYVFILVPRFVRDGFYNWIARNRYRWFGKNESCMVATPELKKKFLENDEERK